MEETRFELAVPPRRERLWGATPGKHCRLGPKPGKWLRLSCRRLGMAGAGPMVRIRFPPAASQTNSNPNREGNEPISVRHLDFGQRLRSGAVYAALGVVSRLLGASPLGEAVRSSQLMFDEPCRYRVNQRLCIIGKEMALPAWRSSVGQRHILDAWDQ